jgi:hypothetical protein
MDELTRIKQDHDLMKSLGWTSGFVETSGVGSAVDQFKLSLPIAAYDPGCGTGRSEVRVDPVDWAGIAASEYGGAGSWREREAARERERSAEWQRIHAEARERVRQERLEKFQALSEHEQEQLWETAWKEKSKQWMK